MRLFSVRRCVVLAGACRPVPDTVLATDRKAVAESFPNPVYLPSRGPPALNRLHGVGFDEREQNRALYADVPLDFGERDAPFLDQSTHEPLARTQQFGSLIHPEHSFFVHSSAPPQAT
jgi:hypothetical protein